MVTSQVFDANTGMLTNMMAGSAGAEHVLRAGAVAPAAAYEGFSIKQLDRDRRGGHAN